MTEPDLLYSDVEGQLRESVRAVLNAGCSVGSVLATYDGDCLVGERIWRALAEDIGIAGLLVPEHEGGAGATPREAAVVLEELGRAVAPVPFLTSSVVATSALLGTGSEFLQALAAGDQLGALAVPFVAMPDAELPEVEADARGRLSGAVANVAGALDATTMLVLGRSGDAGVGLYAVPTSTVEVSPVVSLDMTRPVADLTFDRSAGLLVAEDGQAATRRGLAAGAALLSSEQLGIAQWCLSTTQRYVLQRKQFGRLIGSYQAIKHRLAELYLAVETAEALARYAVAAHAACSTDEPIATAVAQAYCSEAAVRAAEEALQLHGGIGMTWEHPCHLYLKRARADHVAFGTPSRHRARLAELLAIAA